MKKSSLAISFLLVSFSITSALIQLPKTAHLQYNDNQVEVKTLQQILNSDGDTQVTTSGVGSPGQENWYFGTLTLDALKRFQAKYGLPTTGKVDSQTLLALNSVASGQTIKVTPVTNTEPVPKTEDINIEENIYLGETENEYLTSKANTDYIPETTNTANTVATPTTQTYLEAIIAKISNLFNVPSLNPTSGTTQTNIDKFSNTYSSTTPYYNYQTGLYSSNPSYQTQNNLTGSTPYPQGTLPFGSGPSPYGSTFGSTPLGASSQSNGSLLSQLLAGPATPGSENSAGTTNGTLGTIGQCRATSFAHGTLAEGCVADRNDQQNGQRSASGQILSRVGAPAIPAVALPRGGNFGDAIEVKDLSTGRCKAFPLLDRGPSAGQVAKGICIDLTGSAVDLLKGRTPCKTVGRMGEGAEGITRVQFAIIPGEKIAPGQTKECSHLSGS